MRQLLLATTAFVALAASAQAQSGTVQIAAGTSIQAAVNAHPAGTAFVLAPGNYGNQTVNPLSGDSFSGTGATLTGNGAGSAFALTNVQNVTITGLSITGYDKAILATGSSGNTITGNTITDSGTAAINAGAASNNNTITGNTITGVSGGPSMGTGTNTAGVWITGGSDNTIANNAIQNTAGVAIGLSNWDSNPADTANLNVGDTIANNTITNADSSPKATDSGAIYEYGVAGVNTGTKITGNTIQMAALPSLDNNVGIYLDDNTSGITATGNTVAGANTGYIIHGGEGNTLTGNTFNATGFEQAIPNGPVQMVDNNVSGNTIGTATGTPTSVATAALAASPATAPAAQPQTNSAASVSATTSSPTTITPGSGTVTDAAGNTYVITSDGSILENGTTWVAGGGGTSALTIVNGTVYGQDARTGDWLAFSASGQNWTASAAPTGIAAPASTQSAPATTTAGTVGVCSIAASAAASGNFSVKGGQIIAPNGQTFVAEGMNVYDHDMGDAQQILATFPGVNFIRLAAYSYQDPSAYSAFIQTMTAAHVVVEIEDHTTSTGSDAGGAQGSVFTGQALLTEGGWYSALASAYASNPYVWFGTDNEPPGPADQLSTWEQSTYDAIRTSGNNNPILLEAGPGGGVPGMTGVAGGMTASVFASMTNVVWDQHFYPWIVPGVTDLGTIEASIASLVQADQTITSADGTIPVIIAEYGPSTTGKSADSNGEAVVQAVNASGVIAGRAAWNWDASDCCNNLTQSGSVTSPYGATVQSAVAGGGSGGSSGAVATAAPACLEPAAPLSATAANMAAVTEAMTGTAQPGATPVVMDLDSSVMPAASTAPPSASATAVPATDPATAATLSQADATAQQAQDLEDSTTQQDQQLNNQISTGLSAAQSLLQGVH
jgi:parallel beta-helix repeat protein